MNKYLEKIASGKIVDAVKDGVQIGKRLTGHLTGSNVRKAKDAFTHEFNKGSAGRKPAVLKRLDQDVKSEEGFRTAVRSVAGAGAGGAAAGYVAGRAKK